MNEDPDPPPIPPRDPPPKPGAFDWLVGGTKTHEVDIPIESDGKLRVLRVEITAVARVSPNRPWGYIVLVWGMLVLGLLLGIALKPARGAEPWRSYTVGPNTYTDGPDQRSRTWTEGPNTYTDTQRRDGTKTRCRSYRYGANTYTTCD